MENKEKGTNSTKIGADKLAENTSNIPKMYLPKLSAQAQKFGIFNEKKRLHWASIVREYNHSFFLSYRPRNKKLELNVI